LHAFGELKIVTSCDIGDLGPEEGTAVSYYWNPVYNVLGSLPWLLLVLGFVFFRENQKAQALWILLPIIIFRLLWAGFAAAVDIPSEANVMFLSLIDCLLIGFTLNWLLGERIGNRNRFVTWLLAWLIFIVTFAVILINVGFGRDAIQLSIIIGLTIGILMVSFPLAAFICRKKFGPVRFSLWMAVWILLAAISFFMVVGIIEALTVNYSMMVILLQIFMASLIFAGILIAGLLPFEILWFKNAFWKKRFEAVFGIKTRPAPESVQQSELEPAVNE